MLPQQDVAPPDIEVVPTIPPPAPVEELDDKSREVLKAIADMGDEGLTAEELA